MKTKAKAKTRVRVEVTNTTNDGAPASEPTWFARIVDVDTGRTIDHREVAADWGGTGTWFQARKEAAEAREKLAKRGYEVIE